MFHVEHFEMRLYILNTLYLFIKLTPHTAFNLIAFHAELLLFVIYSKIAASFRNL